jgi:hypothetical protein
MKQYYKNKTLMKVGDYFKFIDDESPFAILYVCKILKLFYDGKDKGLISKKRDGYPITVKMIKSPYSLEKGYDGLWCWKEENANYHIKTTRE